MSGGTTVRPVRIPSDLFQQVIIAINRRNLWSMEEGWTLSDFIRVALKEKLAKMRRSRRRKRRRQ